MIRGRIIWPGILAIGLIVGSGSLQADDVYYRWIDDKGDPVHSDRPPPSGTPYEVVSSKTTQVRRVDEGSERSPGGTASTSTGESRARSYLTQQPIPKDPARCQQARDNLATLETAPRIRMQDENGEFYFISDEERDMHKATAQANIDAYCED